MSRLVGSPLSPRIKTPPFFLAAVGCAAGVGDCTAGALVAAGAVVAVGGTGLAVGVAVGVAPQPASATAARLRLPRPRRRKALLLTRILLLSLIFSSLRRTSVSHHVKRSVFVARNLYVHHLPPDGRMLAPKMGIKSIP
jgi:hypothetical protein